MDNWNFDISAAPRGKMVTKTMMVNGKERTSEEFVSDRVILALKGQEVVTISRWLPPQKDRPKGRWEMLATGEEPLAWIAFPDHPGIIPLSPPGE